MPEGLTSIPMPQWVRERLLGQSGTSGPSTSTYDPVEHERRRCQMANRTVGRLGGVDCPDCLNRGYIYYVNDGGTLSQRECPCMAQRRALRHLEQSGLSDMLTRYTFGRWQTLEHWQAKALEEAKRYAANPKGWFIVTGRSGTGKTHLCTAICGELLQQGLPVRYMLWRDVAVRAKAVVNDAEAYSQIVDPLKRVKVLYVDDLFKMGRGSNGAARPTVGDINLVFEIINARYNDSGKITLVSSELSLNDITDIDEATGGRIYEGAKAGAYLDLSNRQNWRLR